MMKHLKTQITYDHMTYDVIHHYKKSTWKKIYLTSYRGSNLYVGGIQNMWLIARNFWNRSAILDTYESVSDEHARPIPEPTDKGVIVERVSSTTLDDEALKKFLLTFNKFGHSDFWCLYSLQKNTFISTNTKPPLGFSFVKRCNKGKWMRCKNSFFRMRMRVRFESNFLCQQFINNCSILRGWVWCKITHTEPWNHREESSKIELTLFFSLINVYFDNF